MRQSVLFSVWRSLLPGPQPVASGRRRRSEPPDAPVILHVYFMKPEFGGRDPGRARQTHRRCTCCGQMAGLAAMPGVLASGFSPIVW